MEQIFNDENGSKITIRYDEVTNIVSVNNDSKDSEFHEVSKCNDEVGPHIFCIDNVDDDSKWTDSSTRFLISDFFWGNKVI